MSAPAETKVNVVTLADLDGLPVGVVDNAQRRNFERAINARQSYRVLVFSDNWSYALSYSPPIVRARTIEAKSIPSGATVSIQITSPTGQVTNQAAAVVDGTARVTVSAAIVGTWTYQWSAIDAAGRVVGKASGQFSVRAVDAPVPEKEIAKMATTITEGA